MCMSTDTPPPTGLIADNVIGFARALRAAGLPVGPGAVIDALNALQVIDIGKRADVFTTLEAIFVKRHEHALVFAQAFDLFFRAAEEWKHLLDSIPLPDAAKRKPPPASRRVQEALAQPSMSEVQQLQEREIIREVRLRVQPAGSGAAYQKFDQPASHYALTGICAVVTLRGGTIASARIGVTGVGAKAYRPTAVEQALVGKSLDEEILKAAVQTVADGVDVQGDIHASPEYRAHLARVLTRRAVLQAAGRAKG